MFKRILAFVIDIVIFFTIGKYVIAFSALLSVVFDYESALLMFIGNILSMWVFHLIFFVLPLYFLGISFGKWLLNLKVTNYNDSKIRFHICFLRENLKIYSVISVVGIVIGLLSYGWRGVVWYDQIFGLDVIKQERIKLTETQRKWRENANRVRP